MSLDKLPINVFDLLVLVVLITGMLRGRKHGMSEEITNLLGWLAVVLGCAAFYEWGSQLIGHYTGLFGLLTRNILAYVGVALLIGLVFAMAKRAFGGKLAGSDVFGRAEYYLGMAAGMVRFCCMLLVVLALLNARAYNPDELRTMDKYTTDTYGSDVFPTLYSVQQSVFVKSVTGPLIRQHLGWLLIKPVEMQKAGFHQKEFSVP